MNNSRRLQNPNQKNKTNILKKRQNKAFSHENIKNGIKNTINDMKITKFESRQTNRRTKTKFKKSES